LPFLFLILLLLSCSKESDQLNLIFQHNNHGKIKSCGCQKSPLGGQLALSGFLNSLKKKGEVLYLTSGSHYLPKSYTSQFDQSIRFDAEFLSQIDKEHQLKFSISSHSDNAIGKKFFNSLLEKSNAAYLQSHHFNIKNRKLALIAIEDSFTSDKIKNLIQSQKDRNIIIVSNKGIKEDTKLAKNFPFIHWIIGSQDEAFTQAPILIGSVKIVQTSSQGHHIGHIQLSEDSKQDQFNLVPMSNKWREFASEKVKQLIAKYTEEKALIDAQEQSKLYQAESLHQKAPDAQSCMECHQKQSDFWMRTSHSLAYLTLLNNSSHHNKDCIGCHSLGYQKDYAFKSTHQIFQLKDQTVSKNYIKELNKLSKNTIIRELSSNDKISVHQKWNHLNQKYELDRHYANVQCLNCHDKNFDHPFSEQAKGNHPIKNKCLNCHTKEQSPSWYNQSTLNSHVFNSMLEKVACPKGIDL